MGWLTRLCRTAEQVRTTAELATPSEPEWAPGPPITGIFNAYKARRKTFKITTGKQSPGVAEYILTDTSTGRVFTASFGIERRARFTPTCFTREEGAWLYNQIRDYREQRIRRVQAFKELRKQRKVDAARAQLILEYPS